MAFMVRRFCFMALMAAGIVPLCSCSQTLAPGDLVLGAPRVRAIPGGHLASYDTSSQNDVFNIVYVFPKGTGYQCGGHSVGRSSDDAPWVEHRSQAWDACMAVPGRTDPAAGRLTLPYDLDGRKKVMTIGGQMFRLADRDNLFVVIFDRAGTPAVTQVHEDLDEAPVSRELAVALRSLFPSKARGD
jgi:hypothetical protein